MAELDGFPFTTRGKGDLQWTVNGQLINRLHVREDERTQEPRWLPYARVSVVAVCKPALGKPATVVMPSDEDFSVETPPEKHPRMRQRVKLLASEIRRAISGGIIEPGVVLEVAEREEGVEPAGSWKKLSRPEDVPPNGDPHHGSVR